MIVTKHGFKKRYAYGGSGIFDTIANFLKECLRAVPLNISVDRKRRFWDIFDFAISCVAPFRFLRAF